MLVYSLEILGLGIFTIALLYVVWHNFLKMDLPECANCHPVDNSVRMKNELEEKLKEITDKKKEYFEQRNEIENLQNKLKIWSESAEDDPVAKEEKIRLEATVHIKETTLVQTEDKLTMLISNVFINQDYKDILEDEFPELYREFEHWMLCVSLNKLHS